MFFPMFLIFIKGNCMLAFVLVASSLLLSQAPQKLDPPKMEAGAFLIEVQKQQARLATIFQDAKLWEKAAKKRDLIDSLEASKLLPSVDLASNLVTRIDFRRYPLDGFDPQKRLSLEETYPVYDALKCMGVCVVPALLRQLGKIDPENRIDEEDVQHNLLVNCLVAIYEQGGSGIVIARERLNLEIGPVAGTERDRLKVALAHPVLLGNKDNKK